LEQIIVVIGVPWSVHELAPAVRDAKRLGARLRLVDTPDMLDRVETSFDIDLVPVRDLAVGEIVGALGRDRVDCVVSLTEMTLQLAAEVREALGHVGTSSQSERSVSNKVLTRQVLSKSGLTRVKFWETSLGDLPSLLQTLELPLVVKPRALTGSTGVCLIQTAADLAGLEVQYDGDVAVSHGRDRLLVESVVAGEEVSAEAMVVDGELTLLAVTDKFNTGPPHFFELGHIIPSRHTANWAAKIAEYLQRIVEALKIVTSPIHAELKLGETGLELIEIHSRFGGDNIIRLLEDAFGVRAFETYFAAMLQRATPGAAEARQSCGVGFLTARLGQDYQPTSFSFPHPERVVEIDFSMLRRPRLEAYEGVKLLYWRLGHCLFASDRYDEVFDNVSFVADRLCVIGAKRPGEREP
jgi:hypothetical protein